MKTTKQNLSRKAASRLITRITNLDRFDHEVEFMNPKSIKLYFKGNLYKNRDITRFLTLIILTFNIVFSDKY